MRLHCLGTAGYHPNESRHTSCYLLPEQGILLDAGTGIFRLPKAIESETLDILLSHAHLDHVVGLTYLIDVLYQRPVERLRIWGESAKLKAVRENLFHELFFPVPLDAEWIEIDDRPRFDIGDATVEWRAQTHPGGSVAYRIDWPTDKRLVYATDTTGADTPNDIEWMSNADLLMHECYFQDRQAEWARETGHSWTSRVVEVAQATTPKRLLLTHINPLNLSDDDVDVEFIRSSVNGVVELATDQLELEF